MSHELYTTIPEVNKKMSRILLGTGAIPENVNADEWLSSMYDIGINAIDTARVYGSSEKTIGNWLQKTGLRENIVILSKCGHPLGPIKRIGRRAMMSDLKKSLKYLQTDYIDIYLLHRDNVEVPVSTVIETFNEMKSNGYIRAFGGSNWTHQRIEEANEYAYKKGLAPFAVSSPNFGLADQIGVMWDDSCVTISGKKQQEARDWYKEKQIPVVAYSSLGRGLFSGRLKSSDSQNADKYLDSYAMKGYAYPENFERLKRCEILAQKKEVTVAQIAMAWIFNQGMDMYAVVSTSSAARMQSNIDALDIKLSEKECRYLDLLEDGYL